MNFHVNSVCRNAFHHLRLISKVRWFMNADNTALLVNALVFSRIDYCGSLLFGITSKLSSRIQRIINYAARLVGGLRRRDSVSAALQQRQWLSAVLRPELRLIMLTYSALNFEVPRHHAALLVSPTAGTHTLRSHESNSLVPQRCKTKVGERAFR